MWINGGDFFRIRKWRYILLYHRSRPMFRFLKWPLNGSYSTEVRKIVGTTTGLFFNSSGSGRSSDSSLHVLLFLPLYLLESTFCYPTPFQLQDQPIEFNGWSSSTSMGVLAYQSLLPSITYQSIVTICYNEPLVDWSFLPLYTYN